MGDADRTPEDALIWKPVCSHCGHMTTVSVREGAALFGMAVVPQRDVDAVARLRAEVDIQIHAPLPELPDHWEPMERVSYRSGWHDAMCRVKSSVDAAAVGSVNPEGEHTKSSSGSGLMQVDPDQPVPSSTDTGESRSRAGSSHREVPGEPAVRPAPSTTPGAPPALTSSYAGESPARTATRQIPAPARPDRCPTCGSADPALHDHPIVPNGDLYCHSRWRDAAGESDR